MKFFNTAGPIRTAENYFIPPLDRVDLKKILESIRRHQYFDIYAPHQTGKTSTLFALREVLNESGQYRVPYLNVASAQVGGSNILSGMQKFLSALSDEAEHNLDDQFVRDIWQKSLESAGVLRAIHDVLTRWSLADSRPLILMIDDFDALSGDMLISVLRQLRSGFPDRPNRFPQTVIFSGVHAVRDYGMRSGMHSSETTSSVFNIKARSLQLGNFNEFQMRSLLLQHTKETAQLWSEAALEEVWKSTQGQPWLVNSLATEACTLVKDRSRQIGHADIIGAREVLIRRRDTHLGKLTDKLLEGSVKRVIEPLLIGEFPTELQQGDVEYVRDLGLICVDQRIEVANPIYREIIPRELIASQFQMDCVDDWLKKIYHRVD